ncbi:MAG: hypothetical protein FWD98_09175 [Defluviitaleaceae bacterium]|nr:hypothetical protein [Defluviitaleaceae bacterium]
MFNQSFTSYLILNGILREDQSANVLKIARETRVRVGVLAVESGLLTVEDVEKINMLQSSQNAKFGDIAVGRGYMTKDQFDSLLTKQPKPHVILKQILTDKAYMSAERFEDLMRGFQASLGASDEAFARIKDNDAQAFVEFAAKVGEDNFMLNTFASLFISTVTRLVDGDILVKAAEKLDSAKLTHFFEQPGVGGGNSYKFCFGTNDEKAALWFAEKYCRFSVNDMDGDGQDSLKEFLNCVSGMMIGVLSNSGKAEIDIEVGEYSKGKDISYDALMVPFVLPAGEFYLTVL